MKQNKNSAIVCLNKPNIMFASRYIGDDEANFTIWTFLIQSLQAAAPTRLDGIRNVVTSEQSLQKLHSQKIMAQLIECIIH